MSYHSATDMLGSMNTTLSPHAHRKLRLAIAHMRADLRATLTEIRRLRTGEVLDQEDAAGHADMFRHAWGEYRRRVKLLHGAAVVKGCTYSPAVAARRGWS